MALVHPTVEYASTVWSPHQATLSDPIEMVQRRQAQYVMKIYGTFDSVTDKLRQQSWDTLEQRRFTARVTMCFRITNQLKMIPVNQFVPYTWDTRGHDKRFLGISASRGHYKFTFFPTVIPLWNSLPQSVVSAFSLEDQNQIHWSPAEEASKTQIVVFLLSLWPLLSCSVSCVSPAYIFLLLLLIF